jgi:DNA repair protein RadC
MKEWRCETCGALRYSTAVGVRRAMSNPEAAHAAVRSLLRHAKQEKLVAIYLDSQNRAIGRPVVVSVGSLNINRTQPREIFAPAVRKPAAALIIAHNHPSGSLDPSVDDLDFTKTVAKAGTMMGIQLYDHLIVSRRGYVSIREKCPGSFEEGT